MNEKSILTLILRDGQSYELVPSGSYGAGRETSGPVVIFSTKDEEKMRAAVKAFYEIWQKIC